MNNGMFDLDQPHLNRPRIFKDINSTVLTEAGTSGPTYGLDLDEVLGRARHCVETAVPE